jgi:hypothetical protein
MTALIEERWEKLQTLSLKHGAHSPDSTFCVMEAAAWVAGEPWTDHPACVPKTIGAFFRTWNDYLPTDADRDRLLKPLIPRLIGLSKTSALEDKRALLCADWFVRNHLPRLLQLVKLAEHAENLEKLPEIKTYKHALAARAALDARAALAAISREEISVFVEQTNQSMLELVNRMIEA